MFEIGNWPSFCVFISFECFMFDNDKDQGLAIGQSSTYSYVLISLNENASGLLNMEVMLVFEKA